MPSIKPTPPLLLARSVVHWALDVEQFVAQREFGALTVLDRQQLSAALLVIDDHRARIETLLNKGERT